MSPGDRIRRGGAGVIGKLVRVRDDEVDVDVDGQEQTWPRGSVHYVSRTFAPRGLTRVNERMLAAARLVAEGKSRQEVAELYGVSLQTIYDWLRRVIEATEDAEHLAAHRALR